MKRKINILIIFLLVLPIFCSAALEFETAFPKLPATGSQLSITPDSSLSDIVKYFITWFIIIGALLAFFSLIIAGLQHLTSIGDPSKTKETKEKVFNSFLGLLILLGSYLILNTINPQLTVLYIEREGIESATVLLSEEGKNKWENGTNIYSLYPENAQFLNYSTEDIRDILGDFVCKDSNNNNQCDDDEIYFKNFNSEASSTLYLVFWEESPEKPIPDVQITFFPKKSYKGTGITFSLALSPTNIKNTPIKLDNVESEVEVYFKNKKIRKKISHPPLSFRISWAGPGAYLFSKNNDIRYIYEERIDNFDSSTINFDDKTLTVSIKNDPGNHDFLLVLFEDAYWKGVFRTFFEKKKRKTSVEVGNVSFTGPSGYYEISLDSSITDQYGKMEPEKASSSYLFELEPENPAETCKEVRVCTKKDFYGDCLIFLADASDFNPSEEQRAFIATTTMPFYEPYNLEEIEVKKYKEDGTVEESHKTNFNDNIKSIKINGNCLVGLFENSFDASRGGWYNDTPGGDSQLFIQSNNDLTNEDIHSCYQGSGILFILKKSCASSLIVYPLKKK